MVQYKLMKHSPILRTFSGPVHLSRNKSYRALAVLASYSIFGSSFCPPLAPLGVPKLHYHFGEGSVTATGTQPSLRPERAESWAGSSLSF